LGGSMGRGIIFVLELMSFPKKKATIGLLLLGQAAHP
jgi:hypothetical protein